MTGGSTLVAPRPAVLAGDRVGFSGGWGQQRGTGQAGSGNCGAMSRCERRGCGIDSVRLRRGRCWKRWQAREFRPDGYVSLELT